MFKSVFAKYFLTFLLIILISFMIIIAVITSIISNYSRDNKVSIVETAANSSSIYLQNKLQALEQGEISDLVLLYSGDIEAVFTAISSNGEDLTIFVTDADGKVSLAVGQDSNLIPDGAQVPQSFMSEIHSGEKISKIGKISGVLETRNLMYAVPIYSESSEICGTVFVCTSSVVMTDLIKEINKAIILAILWIMMAALIAVYFISERVISPLKKISVAAKQFASGKFDTRVPVIGRDEVAELAESFNNMAEALDNYDTMRNTFISNVSHDLRTPMTSISGFVDGIIDGVIPPEKHDYYLRIVSSEVKRLSRLVTSLLDLSRIQAGDRKFNFAEFDICEMGRQIIISFEQKIEEKRLEVEFDCDEDNIPVIADRDSIYQILYNLCDNAVKFSANGGIFRISIKRIKNKKALISVYNEGQGISPADLPYVFERFYKSDKSRGLNKTGVGLGLYISKTIIDAHNEKIWVESEFEKNCCFSFTLPTE
ncbi:MAG: HAMP domain-containing histidine kinase [Clostridia bacterium]|nr:HAMP domain-containing histidine kinase [Clostridia bacterium]